VDLNLLLSGNVKGIMTLLAITIFKNCYITTIMGEKCPKKNTKGFRETKYHGTPK
jgi:uncharacterized membrane protein